MCPLGPFSLARSQICYTEPKILFFMMMYTTKTWPAKMDQVTWSIFTGPVTYVKYYWVI